MHTLILRLNLRHKKVLEMILIQIRADIYEGRMSEKVEPKNGPTSGISDAILFDDSSENGILYTGIINADTPTTTA